MTTMIPRITTTNSDAKERDLLDRDGQPDERRSARHAGRTSARARQPDARQVPPGRPPVERRAACRMIESRLRHRRQRHRQRDGEEGHGDGQGTRRSPSPRRAAFSKDDVDRMVKEAQSHATEGRVAAGSHRRAQPGRVARVSGGEDDRRQPREDRGRGSLEGRGGDCRGPARRAGRRSRRSMKKGDGRTAESLACDGAGHCTPGFGKVLRVPAGSLRVERGRDARSGRRGVCGDEVTRRQVGRVGRVGRVGGRSVSPTCLTRLSMPYLAAWRQ